MHKLRNTLHIAILNNLLERYGESKRISKRQMRIILQSNNWNKEETIDEIEKDIWWCRFCKD